MVVSDLVASLLVLFHLIRVVRDLVVRRARWWLLGGRMQIDRAELEAWQRDQPLSILQLDPADRAVLRVAGGSNFNC